MLHLTPPRLLRLIDLGAVCVAAGLLVSTAGCGAGTGSTPQWRQANAQALEHADEPGWQAIAPSNAQRWSTGFSAVASDRPGLPNAGLGLPRVSADGQWIAFLDAATDADAAAVSPDQWVTGRGLGGVSLWVRGVEGEGPPRQVAAGDVAWPTWSADGSTLVFISHDADTGCALGLHDVVTQRTDRMSVGLKKMLTPSMSPDGRRVAVGGYGEVADQSLIFVVDLDTGRALPGPPPTLGGAQLMPRWLDDDTLLFIELDDAGGGLMRWTVGSPRADPVAPLRLPDSIFDAIHLHAGVAYPVSPDGRYFTYYAPGRDQLVWVALDGGVEASLEPGAQAGTWWNDQWFLVADSEQLALVASPQAHTPEGPGTDTDSRPTMRLLPGRWAPLWADAEERSMLLVGQDASPERFRLIQLWVVTK